LQATRYAANAEIRTAARRVQREQEPLMRSELNESSVENWSRLEPLLDEAMASGVWLAMMVHHFSRVPDAP